MAAVPLVSHTQPRALAAPREIDDRRAFAPSAMDIIDDKYAYADTQSLAGTETYPPSRAIDTKETDILADGDVGDNETTEVYKESLARRRWVWLCWALTFWIPGFMLSSLGRMKRQDVRQAWREKLAINMIIWFICACTIFVIAILGRLICPTQHVYSTSELAAKSYQNDPNNALVAVRGEVFDLAQLSTYHVRAVSVVPNRMVMQYGGLDATTLFPVQVNALCAGTTGSLSQWVTLDTTNTTDVFSKYHDFRAYTNDSRPDWYQEQMLVMRAKFRKGFMGYTKKDIKSMSQNRQIAIYRDKVYDLTTYKQQNGGGLRAPNGTQFSAQDTADRQFISPAVLSLFTTNAGQDITDLFDGLASDIGQNVVNWQRDCLRNLFLLGEVDTRDSPQCQFSTYILLALSVVMVTIIGFKFLAALHFGSSRAPENHDKFVICQVPCYTEGEESLRRTIDSLVKTKYDDKRKLLMVVCDGNIKGFGNDKPTPAIVLDILGVDPTAADPEPLSFQSLGEGAKQHNMGKVYAGLYECSGHVVPYIVIVKVGKPAEKSRPGNRGKRDSQMVVMHFLNKIHFNAPMNPIELEMYHQIKNVIGVNPSFYEYLFMVDADTTVHELSLNRLVSAMMHDKKIIGVCGETSIANSKQSIVTMSQVYEYFISHHLAKAFESLFGSITCLPGCFSMYRLRTPDTHKPLFVSNQIITDYSENRVDTLHLKNLLHLGEDRYLTTLVLKHFPTYKTKFVRDAHAQTVAPDAASVLLSQRRRWINSTVHNLAELVFLDQLCGFCCFSMRFVVFIDLLSTIIAPVTVAYIGYLLYLVIGKGGTIPVLSIIMLAAIYGLQALVFIFRMRWDMIAWMIFYILAIPVFSFFLPLYSFWKMDDFSWGSTRLVVGEKGKKIVIHDEGKFDKASIPLKSWNEYENELWDAQSNHSGDSYGGPGKQLDNRSMTGSGHGYGGGYGAGEGTYAGSAMGGRPGSVAGSGMGMPMNTGMGMPGSAYGHSGPGSRAGSMYGGSQAGYHNPYHLQQQQQQQQQQQAMAMAQMNPMGMSPQMHVGMGMNLNMSPFASNPNLPGMGMMGMGMGGSQGDRGSMYQYQAGGGAGFQMGGSAHGGMVVPGGGQGSRFNSFYGNSNEMTSSPAPSSPVRNGNGAGYAPLSGADPSPTARAHANLQTGNGSGNGNGSSRPTSQFLPPTEQDWAPLDLGEAGISDAQLESSIRRICAGADLDTLTKKGVRKELEKEYGVGFDGRKETITRIIEKVLNE